MKSLFRSSFLRDLRKIRDKRGLASVREGIESIERADNLSEVRNVRRLSGSKSFYRVRLGDYRIGLVVEGDAVEFVRCLHRRDIYRYFP